MRDKELYTKEKKSFPLLKILSIESITERAGLDFLHQRPLVLPHFDLLKNKAEELVNKVYKR